MPGFTKLDEEVIHEGFVVTFATGRFSTPDGEVVVRDVLHHPGAVCVVPVVDGEVVLVRQFRAACNQELLEIPAGKRDLAAEPPEVTARRELIEEVGLDAGELVLLSQFFNSPGFCDEELYLYLATDCVEVANNLQGPEERHMSIERYPLDQAVAMIATGELHDAKSIIGVLLAQQRLA